MDLTGLPFDEVWALDFEFCAPRGERPTVVCLVARELRSGRLLKFWQDDLQKMPNPPYSISCESLIVAYFASAEMSCHLALGWALPVNLLDLFTEFRNLTNGPRRNAGNSLLAALKHFDIDHIESAHKEKMRQSVIAGGPWNADQRKAIIDYCESDVIALAELLPAMLPNIDLPHALMRGRYMKAAACMEFTGTPIDVQLLEKLQSTWDGIKSRLIAEVNLTHPVFCGRTFKTSLFAEWLNNAGIAWPHNAAGSPDLRSETFKEMAMQYDVVAPLKAVRDLLSKIRNLNPSVGKDGRNRCLLSPFRTITGRNQPSTRDFVFALPAWLRGLIRPEPGRAIAYIDFQQQEFGIAAALSHDPQMLAAYASGDPYLSFAKQAGAVPDNATKQSHKNIRDQFKTASLAVQYGQTAESLALRIGRPPAYARELLEFHRRTYSTFWRWSDDLVDRVLLSKEMWTVFGWKLHVDGRTKSRTIGNFPSQANGAEMLRLACCFATEAGVNVCAPVHDAVLIEAGAEEIDQVVVRMQRHMKDASNVVLGGLELRSDASIVRWPDRFEDERRGDMLSRVLAIADDNNTSDNCAAVAKSRLSQGGAPMKGFAIPRSRK